jgi:cyclophilin family peptidyl-prolyl cis-trans isomerase
MSFRTCLATWLSVGLLTAFVSLDRAWGDETEPSAAQAAAEEAAAQETPAADAPASDAPSEEPALSETTAASAETPTEPEAPQAPPKTPQELMDEYAQAMGAFQQHRQQINVLVAARPSDAEGQKQWQDQVDDMARKSNELMARVTQTASAAFEANDKDQDLAKFLVVLAMKSSASDLLEDAARLSSMLTDHGILEKQLLDTAYSSQLELGNFDLAEKYLQLAEEKGLLTDNGKAIKPKVALMRAPVEKEMERRAREASADDLPRVLFHTNRGDIVIELFEDDCPNAVASVIKLVESGYYNGKSFFRVAPGFGASTGCEKGDGTGNPGYWLAPELKKDDIRPHLRGTVSMLRTPAGVNAGQLFFTYRMLTTSKLNGVNEVVGRVIEGLDVVSRLRRADPMQSADLQLDRILDAQVLRKRNHKYVVQTTTDLANEKRILAMKTKDTGERMQYLAEALAINPEQYDAHLMLGILFREKGMVKEAHHHFSQAVRINPRDVDSQLCLGASFVAQKRYDDAITTFRNLIRLNSRELRAYNNLAAVLVDRGKVEEARKVLQEALVIDPNYQQAKDNLARLRDVQ